MTAGDGLRRPVNAPAAGQIATGVQPGISSGIVIANRVIIVGANGGIFVYSGTPAAGNLIATVSSSPGTDNFGNPYLGAPDAIFTTYNFSSTLAMSFGSNNLVGWHLAGGVWNQGAVLIANFDVGLGIGFWEFFSTTLFDQAVTFGSTVAFTGMAQPAAGTAAILYANTSGRLGEVAPSGYAGQLPVDRTDTTVRTNANNGSVLMTPAWSIPANDAVAGSEYLLDLNFNGTFQTATLAFKPNLSGTVEATSNGDTVSTALFGAGTGFTGHVRLRLIVTAAGAGGTCDLFIDGGIGQNLAHVSTNQAYLSSQATAAGFDTTAVQTIGVESVWGASVASQTVTCRSSTITRKGP